jgi:uncharacterized protein DUF2442
MSTILHAPVCIEAAFRDGHIHVTYSDGKKVSFSISANRRLRGQPAEKLNHIEIGHFGLSWPDLDEDLSHEGLRAGRFGQP